MSVAGLFAPVDFHTHGPVEPPVDPTSAWFTTFETNRDYPMPRQLRDWTCSICSIDWVALATGLDPSSSREKVTIQMFNDPLIPNCVNANVGLVDALCALRVMRSWGVDARQQWLSSWDDVVAVCSTTAGILNSIRWQHYVAIRGLTDDGQLWIANSAPGWMNIYSTISRAQFEQWSGSWQSVSLVR